LNEAIKSEQNEEIIQNSEDSIPMQDLFLLKLPDETTLIFYNNGRKAVSRTSSGYIAIFDNVSTHMLHMICTMFYNTAEVIKQNGIVNKGPDL